MSVILRIYCEDKLYSIDMSKHERVTIGNGKSDTLNILECGLKKAHITVVKKRDGYVIKGKDLYNRMSTQISSDEIVVGSTYIVNTIPRLNISVHPLQEGRANIDIGKCSEVLIGRDPSNNIIMSNGRTSSKHCKITRESGLIKIKDLRSSNGTYVNGRKVLGEKILSDGDVINFSVYEATIDGNLLTLYNIGNDLNLNITETNLPRTGKTMPLDENYSKPNPVYDSRKKGTVSLYGDETESSYSDDVSVPTETKKHTMSVFGDEVSDYSQDNQTHIEEKDSTMSVFGDNDPQNNSEQTSGVSATSRRSGTMSVFDE